MFYVYIIKSERLGTLYIGYSTDLQRRLEQHNSGTSEYTKHRGPWRLVYYEAFTSEADARTRELALKDFGRAYGQLKRRISHSLEDT
ncbi:MAG TPA: GIY-YIG nuclease family protein [bacterium]|nr:GIY-YIG nuclease family protein [bacterium]